MACGMGKQICDFFHKEAKVHLNLTKFGAIIVLQLTLVTGRRLHRIKKRHIRMCRE
jgi:hypothetical protein